MARLSFVSALLAWVGAVLALSLPYLDIESVRSGGADMILWLQRGGTFVEHVAKGFSLLGDDFAYIAALPVLIYSVSCEVGIETFVLFFVNLVINAVLKTLLHGPRPSWTLTPGLVCEIEYGNPSGHSQSSFLLFCFAAHRIARYYDAPAVSVVSWCVALFIATGIAVSRCVVGAHFPHQVLAGSLLGLALFATHVSIRENKHMCAALQTYASGRLTSAILGLCVTFVGCGSGVAAWAITAASFEFPSSWAKNAAKACPPDELIDEFGGVRYTFLAVGLLAAMAFSYGLGTFTHHCKKAENQGLSLRGAARGIMAVVVTAVAYLGVGEAIPKTWHIVPVLILRYYFRGLFTGMVVLWLYPLILHKVGCFLDLPDEGSSTVSQIEV